MTVSDRRGRVCSGTDLLHNLPDVVRDVITMLVPAFDYGTLVSVGGYMRPLLPKLHKKTAVSSTTGHPGLITYILCRMSIRICIIDQNWRR